MEVLVLSLVGVLALANGLKAIGNVRGTVQITVMYHTARIKNPEALGQDPEEARKKVEGFLATIIGNTMIHSANTAVCLGLGWSLWKDSVPGAGDWEFVFFALGILSALGSLGLAGTVVSKWLELLRTDRAFDDLIKTLPSKTTHPKMKAWKHALILFAMGFYVVTASMAVYFMTLLYQSS